MSYAGHSEESGESEVNNLLTYTEFRILFGVVQDTEGKLQYVAEIRGVCYDDLVKALQIARRTLYNEKSASGWRVKKVIGSAVYFEPQDVYEWYVDYSVQRQRKRAA